MSLKVIFQKFDVQKCLCDLCLRNTKVLMKIFGCFNIFLGTLLEHVNIT